MESLDQELLDLLGANNNNNNQKNDNQDESNIGYRRPTHGGKRPPQQQVLAMDLSDEDESESESEEQQQKTKPANRTTGGKKPLKAAKKPPKKKPKKKRRDSDDSEEDEEDEDSEDSSFLSSSDHSEPDSDQNEYNSDQEELDQTLEELARLEDQLSGERMEGLTEFEREQRMAELGEKKQRLLEKLEIKKRLMRSVNASGGGRQRAKRDRKAVSGHQQAALKKLKDKRRRKARGVGGAGSDSDSDDDDLLDLDSDEDEDGLNYRQRIRGTYDAQKRGGVDEGAGPAWLTLADVNGLRVTRDQMEKWVYAPFFTDVVVGCFVRVGLGLGPDKQPVYRVAQIVDVAEYHRAYKLNQLTTKTALKLKHGRAEKVFLMDVLSNGEFTEGEFNRWMKTMQADKERVMSKTRYADCKKRLDQARTHVFTDADIAYMVRAKAGTVVVPKNLSTLKLRLMTKRDEAVAHGDQATEAKLTRQLAQINRLIENGGDASYLDDEYEDEEQVATTGGSAKKKDLWARLNERNRRRNFEQGGKAEQIIRQQRMEDTIGHRGGSGQPGKDGKGGTNGGAPVKRDPFARIKAAPTIQIHHHAHDDDSQLSTPVDEKQAASGPGSGHNSRNNSTSNLASPSIVASAVDTTTTIVTPTDAYSQALQSVDLDIDI